MDEIALTRRLALLEPPGIDAARTRAALAVTSRVLTARTVQRPRAAAERIRIAATVAAIVLGAATFALFTAPGKAVTSWAGERLGFGEPGGPPTLEDLRESWLRGTVADGRPAYVLAVGPAPHDGRYEFVAYRPAGAQQGSVAADEAPCFEVDLPQERSSTGQGCGILPEGGSLFLNGVGGGSSRSGGTVFYGAGRVGPEVASVEASVNGNQVEVDLVPIPAAFGEPLGVGPFGFFIAFLDDVSGGGTLDVTARDESGAEVGHATADVPEPQIPEGP